MILIPFMIQDSERAIGLSSPCCLVCAHLLKLLTSLSWDRKPFMVTGQHNTVASCSLPEWLPSDVIYHMILKFGDLLREELVQLMNRTEELRTWGRPIDDDSLTTENCRHQ
jgi:hypothetical protein